MCRCAEIALWMNDVGPEMCLTNKRLIVDVMVDEAMKRDWLKWLPLKEVSAGRLVDQAVAEAKATHKGPGDCLTRILGSMGIVAI